jgi:hypothetical protein
MRGLKGRGPATVDNCGIHAFLKEPVPYPFTVTMNFIHNFFISKGVNRASTLGGKKGLARGDMLFVDGGIEDPQELKDGIRVIGDDTQSMKVFEVEENQLDGDNRVYLSQRLAPVIVPISGIHTAARLVSNTTDPIDEEGLLFEYFNGMLLPNKDSVAGIFFRHFSRCIIDKIEELEGLAPMLRRGFVDLQTSDAGKVLQHIYYRIQCSVETGSKLRIVVDKETYRGFVLIGGNIAMLIDGVDIH